MKSSRQIVGIFFGLLFASVIAAQATVVWDLNPVPRKDAPAGTAVLTYTSPDSSAGGSFAITAHGYDNNAGIGSPHELYFKNKPEIDGSVEFGLGLANTLNNEIQPGLHFIQFDFTAALAAGLFNGQISVGSVQPGELFAFYGSNTLGTLGTQVGGPFGSAEDDQFVAIPGFGQFNYYSVVALANDVLPIAVRADLLPVPEANALLPIAGLVVLLAAGGVWRKRRAATLI
jgi:hypothetical protein